VKMWVRAEEVLHMVPVHRWFSPRFLWKRDRLQLIQMTV
jgi:hypothetical protein